nr:hypothetical protein [Tanacetum cinerariifolium]
TRSDAPSSGTPLLLPISASTSLPPLQLPSTSHREDRPEVGESSSAAAARPAGGLKADYGFMSTDTELGGYMREFETRVRRDTDEIYMRLDDEQSERQLLADRLNMLFRDRRAYVYTHHLMETEARLSREAWMTEIRELHAVDRRRHIVILEMLRADHRRSTEIIGLRTALQGHVTVLQGQVIALQTQVTALQGQQGLVGGPTQPELPELPEEAGS